MWWWIPERGVRFSKSWSALVGWAVMRALRLGEGSAAGWRYLVWRCVLVEWTRGELGLLRRVGSAVFATQIPPTSFMHFPGKPSALRAIIIIALFQIGVVLGGTLYVGSMLKARGYNPGMGFGPPYSMEAVFVQNYGLSFLVIPVLWVAGAVYAESNGAAPELRPTLFVFGLVVLFLAVLGYLMIGETCYQWMWTENVPGPL